MTTRQVTKEEFYAQLDVWGHRNLDPVPSRIDPDLWKCQKTGRIFGRTIGTGYAKNTKYFLSFS